MTALKAQTLMMEKRSIFMITVEETGTLFILMDFPKYIDTISMGESILCSKGSESKLLNES